MNLIIDLQYFPSVILFKNLFNFSNVIFEQYESYQKMSFRNRCLLAGSEGVIPLSIPLAKGRDQKTLLKDVKIADGRSWQAQHWKTIVSCYSRSPWFDFYREDLEGLYRQPYKFLLDWNRACFEWTLRTLPMGVPVSLTGEYRKEYDGQEWVDWRGKFRPKDRGLADGPGDGPAAPAGGGTRGLAGSWSSGGAVIYHQVFEDRTGFIPDLSILDLLFCEGKRALSLLSQAGFRSLS